MNSILEDFSEAALAKANEDNLYASTPFLYNLPGAEVYKGDDVSWCITDIPVRACNVIFNARLKPENADRVIKSITGKARIKNVPLRWYVGKDTGPADLGQHLVSTGFVPDKPAPMMAFDLRTLEKETRPVKGLEIAEVKDSDTMAVWCDTCSRGFGGMPQSASQMLKWLSFILEHNLPMRFFMASYHGVPVATSQLLTAEGVAGIDRVAVLPEARNKGIGRAITLYPLLIARDTGYRVGTLQASEMGERLYRSMGFWKCGELTSYHWWMPQ
jgi:GNAT superfamily N-acetyltransferase